MITLIFGDSISWGAFDLKDSGWAAIMQKKGFEKEDFVYNCSISGNTSSDIVNRMWDEINTRFDAEDDMRIIFAFGINDAARIGNRIRSVQPDVFEKNIKEIIETVYTVTDDIYFIGPTLVDETKTLPVAWNEDLYYYNKDILEYNEILKTALKPYKNFTFIEMIDVVSKEELYDGVHPDCMGHLHMWQKIRDFVK